MLPAFAVNGEGSSSSSTCILRYGKIQSTFDLYSPERSDMTHAAHGEVLPAVHVRATTSFLHDLYQAVERTAGQTKVSPEVEQGVESADRAEIPGLRRQVVRVPIQLARLS